jgi:hypothetical protein
VKTRHLQLVTQEHSVTVVNKSPVLSPFGPANRDWIIVRRIQDQLLTESLSSLEREVGNLVSKSFTVLDTLTTATKEMLAEPLPSTIDTAGTDV